MGDVYEEFARAERAIEEGVIVEPGIAASVGLTVARYRRRRRALWGSAAGAVVLASTAGIASASTWWPDDLAAPMATSATSSPSATASDATTASPSASADVSPSPSVSPTQSPDPATAVIADGATPASAYPSSSVPWSQVGPGWNLVSFASFETEADGLALLAPDGTWYSVADPQAPGLDGLFAWDGVNAWMGSITTTGSNKSVTLVDVKTGASQGSVTVRSQDINFLTGVAPGVSLTYLRTTGSALVGVVGPSAGAAKSCEGLNAANFGSEAGNAGVLFLPGSGGSMVCMVPAADNRTTVTLVNTATGATTVLGTLEGPNASYSVVGWVDGQSFVFAQLEKAYSDKIKQLYRFTIPAVTGGEPTIAPVTVADVQLGVSLPQTVSFDRVSGRFLVQVYDNTSGARNSTIAISTLDGRHIATVKSGCYDPVTYTTGEFLVAWCPSNATLSRWKLSDGSAAGVWGSGTWIALGVAGYPDK